MATPRSSLDSSRRRYRGRPVLVVGLGLSGHATVRHLLAAGARVSVVDSRAEPAGADQLAAEHPEVRLFLGGFDVDGPLERFEAAVVAPGVDLREPLIASLRDAGVPILGDVELFAACANAPVVGITGSNGKSTVTTLVGEMARAAGLNVAVGGNLGTPVLDLLDAAAQLYVLELSSFQLDTTETLELTAAAWLNLSEDHLDRHGDMSGYANAKARIFAHCETAVVNADDIATLQGSERAARRVRFGLSAATEDPHYGYDDEHGWLLGPGDERLIRASELKIRGRHNLVNALAAIALADAAGISRDAQLAALRGFDGLPHRCVAVAERDGVTWIDDSKGTNVGATLAALQGFDPPIVWLGGGQGKGQDFSPLIAPLAAKGRAAIVFGQDAALLGGVLEGHLPVYREATLDASVQRAAELAQPGDTVLLSPACASLDQFRNYVERGQRFAACVESLA